MDPKGGQILDPKLKEAYDRVMGASLPPATPKPPTPPAATPPPAPAQPPHTMAGQAPPAAAPLHSDVPKPAEHHDGAPPPPQHVTPPPPTNAAPAAPAQNTPSHGSMSFSSAYVAPHAEKKSPVSGGLLIFVGVIFLMVYTLFWMKWFGMAIPFLP